MEIIDLSNPRNREMVAEWASRNPAVRIDTIYSKAEVRAALAEYRRLVAAESASAAVAPVPPKKSPAHRCWECGSPIPTASATCAYCGESAASNWML